jgi:hypothetical protein
LTPRIFGQLQLLSSAFIGYLWQSTIILDHLQLSSDIFNYFQLDSASFGFSSTIFGRYQLSSVIFDYLQPFSVLAISGYLHQRSYSFHQLLLSSTTLGYHWSIIGYLGSFSPTYIS